MMKKNIVLIIFVILTSCSSIKYIPLEENGYVRLNQLNLTFFEKEKLSWLTRYDSPFIIYNNRYQCFYYKIDYDYTKIINK